MESPTASREGNMSFSNRLYISKIERKRPKDEEEWLAKVLKILLSKYKKWKIIPKRGGRRSGR